MHQLLLMVKNPNSLEKGTLPSHIFDIEGGTVGALSNNDWYMDNYMKNIGPIIFTIFYIDGEYCLQANDVDIFINHSHNCLNLNTLIRLKTGDSIRIKDYIINAKIVDDSSETLTYESSLLSILGIEDLLLLSGEDAKFDKLNRTQDKNKCELLVIENYHTTSDPIEVLSEKNDGNKDDELITSYDKEGLIPKDNLNISHNEPFVYDVSRTNTGVIPTFVSKINDDEIVVSMKPVKKEKKADISINNAEVEILDPLELFDSPFIKEK